MAPPVVVFKRTPVPRFDIAKEEVVALVPVAFVKVRRLNWLSPLQVFVSPRRVEDAAVIPVIAPQTVRPWLVVWRAFPPVQRPVER